MDLLGWVMLATLVFLVAIAATTKHWRWLALGVGIAGLAACMTACKPGDTKVVTKTQTVEVERVRYVRIPDKLTAPIPVPQGPLNQVIDVAKKRGEAIEACNGRLAEIGGIEGTKPC